MTPAEDPLEAALLRAGEEYMQARIPGFRPTPDYTMMVQVLAAMIHRYHGFLLQEIATKVLPSMTIPTVEDVAKEIVGQLLAKGATNDRAGAA